MYKIIGADQKEYGPVSSEQLRQWIAEGRVNAQTRVQLAGSTEWTTVGSLPEFAPTIPPPPPASVPGGMQMGALHLPPQRRTNQMAVWSLVIGIVSLMCCQWYLGPVAIVLGAVALAHLKHHPEETGSGMAIAGIVLGAVALLLGVLFIIAFVANPDLWQRIQSQIQQGQ